MNMIQLNVEPILGGSIINYAFFVLLVAVVAALISLPMKSFMDRILPKKKPFREIPPLLISEQLQTIVVDTEMIKACLAKLEPLTDFLSIYDEEQSKTQRTLTQLDALCSGIQEKVQAMQAETEQTVMKCLNRYARMKEETEGKRPKQVQYEQEQEPCEEKQELTNHVQERYRTLSAHSNLLSISNLVTNICTGLQAQSAMPVEYERIIPPYLEVASKAQELECQIHEMPTSMAGAETLDSLEHSLSSLKSCHRVPWIIGLLDIAKKSPSLQEQSRNLENLLGLQEIYIDPGKELKEYKHWNPSVVESDGDGQRTVISEMVEAGYLDKASGTVIKPPKVRVRFEG